jgi:ABC-type spermidine/putrescine transport system permease subunit I
MVRRRGATGKRAAVTEKERRLMALVQWGALAAFALLVMSAALYGLTASGQFPSEHRAEALKSSTGVAILWGTMAAGVLTTLIALFLAWVALPWYAAVIVGGCVLLMAPLVLQLFPDSFVDGRGGLLVFAGVGGALSLCAMLFG